MIIEYLLAIGSFLYLVSAGIFFYLWLKTLRVKDGAGLIFLRLLTFAIFLGSLTIFSIRILSEYRIISFLLARAIAIVNPILIVITGLYLNFLFHNKNK